MKKYQGEDISFSLNFNTSTNSDISSFNDLYNVLVYAYTNEDNVAKFSRVIKDGYELLVDPDGHGLILKGVISSEYTKEMNGQIILDVMCIKTVTDGDLTENIIQKALSGIFIVPTVIKAEA